MPKFRSKQSCLLALALLLPAVASAHRVNVFAWEENGKGYVEGKFAGGKPAVNSSVSVKNLQGDVFARGTTDEKGAWSFPLDSFPPGTKLIIDLNAGEGHKAKWTLEVENEGAARMVASPEPEASPKSPEASPAAQEAKIREAVEAERARLEKEVIGPLRRENAELKEPKITWKEVFGGVGWLLGIFGIAAWWTGRRKESAESDSLANQKQLLK